MTGQVLLFNVFFKRDPQLGDVERLGNNDNHNDNKKRYLLHNRQPSRRYGTAFEH